MDDRGQTLQDFALGVSLFLVTVTFVFGYVPTVFAQYDTPVDGIDQQQADRVAEYTLDNYSVDGRSNTLRHNTSTGIVQTLDGRSGFDRFREVTGLNTSTRTRARPNVNVRLVNTSEITADGPKTPMEVGGKVYEFGEDWARDTPAASERRIVRLDNNTGQCRPSCWLVVRVW